MSLRNLRIFQEVYRTGSVTQASRNLYLAQPAVSRAIRELENEYHVILFERRNHALIRTNIADLLYAKTDIILKNYDALEESLKEEKETGTIHLGTNTTAGKYIIPSAASAFHEEYPQIRLEVSVNNEVTLLEEIEKNRLDLAIVENTVTNQNMDTVLAGKSEMCAIAAYQSDYPDTMELSDLRKYPVLLREKGSAQRHYMDALFEAHDLSITPLWQSSSTDALIYACMCNIGISFVPKRSVEEYVKNKKLRIISITDEKLIRNCYLVSYKDKYFNEAVQYLISLIKKDYADTI